MMGYGLIHCSGQQVSLIAMGVLKLSARKDPYERLQLIHKKVNELIREFHPHEFAIEAPFFGKNVQSMLKLGRAQGVAIATAMHAGLSVTEYSPRKVKQSVTGNGNSAKEQVWKMLQTILHLDAHIKEYDASDALAVALCHHFQNKMVDHTRRSPGAGSTGTAHAGIEASGLKAGRKASRKANGWDAFVRQNPEKVRKR